MLQAQLQLVQAQVQDVCAGLQLRLHGDLLSEGQQPAGVLTERLTHRPGAVALQELLTGGRVLELHLHPEEGVGLMDLQYLITSQTSS